MSFSVTILGSSSAKPTVARHPSAQAVNVHEQYYLVETFWVAPYDLRRDFPVLVNFERHARHASVLLGKIDFASASGAQIYELGKTVAALDRAVRQIAEARLFSPVECAEAQELVGRIRNALPAACAAGLAAALSHDSE